MLLVANFLLNFPHLIVCLSQAIFAVSSLFSRRHSRSYLEREISLPDAARLSTVERKFSLKIREKYSHQSLASNSKIENRFKTISSKHRSRNLKLFVPPSSRNFLHNSFISFPFASLFLRSAEGNACNPLSYWNYSHPL